VGSAECAGLGRSGTTKVVGDNCAKMACEATLRSVEGPMAQRRSNLSPNVSNSTKSDVGCAVRDVQSLSVLAREWLSSLFARGKREACGRRVEGMDRAGRARVREEMAERPQRAAVFVVLEDDD
jgi:hypothetical protein